MIGHGNNAEIRKKAFQLIKINYGPLFLISILSIVLENGSLLGRHFLSGAFRSVGNIGAVLLVSIVVEISCFFLSLCAYRMCVELIRGAGRPFWGMGFAFRGRGRVWMCFRFYLLFQIPVFLKFIVNTLYRSFPTLVGMDSMQMARWFGSGGEIYFLVTNLFFWLGVQMILFPVQLCFVLHPGRGTVDSLRRGVPLGVRKWFYVAVFRAVNILPVTILRNIFSWLAGVSVTNALGPIAPEPASILEMVDFMSGNSLFWVNWISRVAGGLVMALFLPYLQMCDVLFAGERLGLEVKVENRMRSPGKNETR